MATTASHRSARRAARSLVWHLHSAQREGHGLVEGRRGDLRNERVV